MIKRTIFLLLLVSFPLLSFAADIPVAPGESIQAAIDSSSDGDVIILSAGEYVGDIDYKGKAITIRGVGRKSLIRGTGTGSVVSFTSGETSASVLDSVRITGGNAARGGGSIPGHQAQQLLEMYLVEI